MLVSPPLWHHHHQTLDDTGACTHARRWQTPPSRSRLWRRVQRLEVLIAVMLARERRVPADTVADGCTALATELLRLPSRFLEMVADVVVALPTCQFYPDRRMMMGWHYPDLLSTGSRRRIVSSSESGSLLDNAEEPPIVLSSHL